MKKTNLTKQATNERGGKITLKKLALQKQTLVGMNRRIGPIVVRDTDIRTWNDNCCLWSSGYNTWNHCKPEDFCGLWHETVVV